MKTNTKNKSLEEYNRIKRKVEGLERERDCIENSLEQAMAELQEWFDGLTIEGVGELLTKAE